jgi:acetyl esterase/lipase
MENILQYQETRFETEIQEDLAFGTVTRSTGEPETLHLDVYQPAGDPAELRPAVLWFHGGGFRPGNDKRQRYIPLFARAFAARGFVGIAPDYRIRENPDSDLAGTIEDAVSDGRSALGWVQTHAADYRIDPHRVILAGGSAGGMLVTNLVHSSEKHFASQLEGVCAVVDLWGTPAGTQRRFTQINPAAPATFIVHGTADALVPYQNSLTFASELQQAGIPHTFLTLPDAPHTPFMHFDQIVQAVSAFLSPLVSC